MFLYSDENPLYVLSSYLKHNSFDLSEAFFKSAFDPQEIDSNRELFTVESKFCQVVVNYSETLGFFVKVYLKSVLSFPYQSQICKVTKMNILGKPKKNYWNPQTLLISLLCHYLVWNIPSMYKSDSV